MKLELYPEICCELCNDTIHNHVDCPACGQKYAGTDLYGSLCDEEVGFILSCEECKTQFKLTNKDGVYGDEYEWEQLS